MFYSNKRHEYFLKREVFQGYLVDRYHEAVTQDATVPAPIIQGRITKEILNQRVPADVLEQAHFFMCGSPAFMGGMQMILREMGIPQERIHTEDFSF